MNKDFHETKTKIPKTPDIIKELFKPFLFPCNNKKIPAIPKGSSWERHNRYKKPVFRGTEYPLCGVDCGEAKIVVVDGDTYKPDFKQSKESQTFYNECRKKSKFFYKTQSGGGHIYFKMPKDKTIECSDPFPCVEIKAKGGYVCVYGHPAPLGDYEDWESFYNDLPTFDYSLFGKKEHREFGPGQNNRAIPHRAGKAGAQQNAEQAAKDIIELLTNNANRPDFDSKKHLTDYLKKYEKSFFINTPPPRDKSPQKEQKPISSDLDNVKIRPITYLDQCKMFLRGHLTTLAGAKGSLKSRGVLSYLLKENIKVGYYSDFENTKSTAKKIAEAAGHGKNLTWFDFSRTDEKGFWDQITKEIKDSGIDLMMEDPPYETLDFNNTVGIRKVLGKRADLADKLNIGWLVTRNFSKNESRQLENRVGGFAHWVTMPRACIMTHKAEKDTPVFKESQSDGITKDGLLHLALLQSWVVNEGPLPEKSIKMRMEKGENGPIMTFSQINRVAKPQFWGKGASTQEKEASETLFNLSLALLKEKPLSPGDFKRRIVQEYKISLSGAKRIVRALKKEDYIEGGGSGRVSKDFFITEKGEKFLNE